MISFNTFVEFSPQELSDISKALELIGKRGVKNIWDRSILRSKLSPDVAERLIELQKKIRSELVSIVGPYCTYCHSSFSNPNYAVVDHFVLKSASRGMAKFTYDSLNFLLSCSDCNKVKGQKKTFDPSVGVVDIGFYHEVRFTHFHPNIHAHQDYFEIRNSVVVARRKEGVDYLDMIGYMTSHQQPKIMCLYHLRNSQTTSTEIEDRVDMLISRPRFRSGAV